MRELQQREKSRRILYSIPVILLVAFVAFMTAKGAYGVFLVERTSAEKARDLEIKVAALESRERELQTAIARLGTEEGLREEIKSKFNVTDAGERVAIVVDPRPVRATTTQPKIPWYKRMWSVIISP